MRVALTGAAGFTGRFVINALEKAGAECVALEADLRDAAAIGEAVERLEFDRLIHLAGRAFVNAVDWEGFYAVNQIGTYNLLTAVAKVRPGARCILASSAQVYSSEAEGLLDETALTAPSSHYALSKLAMEQGAALWRDQLDIVTTRPFNYTGVGQGLEYLVPKLVGHFRRRAEFVELGNTWVKRDFGDVRSVADAYAGLVLADQAPSVVNICTGSVHSIGELLQILTDISGYSVEVRVNAAFVRTNDVAVLGGDDTRLRAALPGWRPRDVTETLSWMFRECDSAS